MRRRTSRLPLIALWAFSGLALAACATGGGPLAPGPEPTPLPAPLLPPAFGPQEIVGRWGLAAFHQSEDRARSDAPARAQVKQPYISARGPTGGVMMHLADQPTPEELRLKGGPGGKTFIGPEGEPAGNQDREVVSFDGRVLVLRWIDQEVQGRYGNMVYVRCGVEGEKRRPAAKPKPKAKPKPAPKPASPPKPQ